MFLLPQDCRHFDANHLKLFVSVMHCIVPSQQNVLTDAYLPHTGSSGSSSYPLVPFELDYRSVSFSCTEMGSFLSHVDLFPWVAHFDNRSAWMAWRLTGSFYEWIDCQSFFEWIDCQKGLLLTWYLSPPKCSLEVEGDWTWTVSSLVWRMPQSCLDSNKFQLFEALIRYPPLEIKKVNDGGSIKVRRNLFK